MSPPPEVRLAELLGGLSLACDVADGFPLEKVMRTAVLAVGLGRHHGLADQVLRDAYYASMLRYTGCTAFAHEEAHRYGAGDDVSVRQAMALADPTAPMRTVAGVVAVVGRTSPPLARAAAVARLLGDGRAAADHSRAQCEVSIRLAELVGMSEGVRAALGQICERYDGRGHPHHLAGEALTMPSRIAHLADVAEIAHHRGGRPAAYDIVRRRAGGHFDPALARTFLAHADELLAGIEGPSVWDRFCEAEPPPQALAGPGRVDDLAMAFALMADIKSGWTAGHSPGVAALAGRAAEALGLPADERQTLRRAALLHDLGRVSAPNRVWDKPGPLSAPEWEQVRMHAYWTERVLSRAPALREAAQVACAAHERIDGGGYHRAVPAPMLARAARLLAAADAFHAMGEPRPHRPALDREAATRALRGEVDAGRLDGEAVEAVLGVSGAARAPGPAARRWPGGLSDREVQVLRLLARGGSNKEIAAALGISPRTAQHHVIHIYQKIDVSSRAAAALFAMEHDLLGQPGLAP